MIRKNQRSASVAKVMVVLAICFVGSAPAASGAELLMHPDLPPWVLYVSGVGDPDPANVTSVTGDAGGAFEGSEYIHVETGTVINGGNAYGGVQFFMPDSFLNMPTPQTYSLSFALKSLTGSPFGLSISNQDGSGEQNALSHDVTVNTDWTLHTRTATLDGMDLGGHVNKPRKRLIFFTNMINGGPGQIFLLDRLRLEVVSEPTILTELLIDSPPVTLDILGNVEIAAGAEVNITPGYSQASATLETILAVTHTGTLTGLFANEGEHLRDGIFVDTITYNPNDITVDILQAAPGDLNGDRVVDASDIQLILAANSFNNSTGGPYTWLQGDNNGDGLVNALDIQNILAANLFGQPAYAAQRASTAAVPEPSSLVLAALGLLSLLAHGHRRRRA